MVGLQLWLQSQPFKNWTIKNLDIFVWISNGFRQNGGPLSGFQMVGLPDFRFQSKSRLGRISDPPCMCSTCFENISWFFIELYALLRNYWGSDKQKHLSNGLLLIQYSDVWSSKVSLLFRPLFEYRYLNDGLSTEKLCLYKTVQARQKIAFVLFFLGFHIF